MLLHEELAGDEVLVVSNREPYMHMRTGKGIEVQTPRQRPGDRGGAGDARLLGHLDRAWQRLGRPRNRGPQ